MRRQLFGTAVYLMLVTGCVGLSSTPEEQYEQAVQAKRMWLRGPMMNTCAALPGPESRRGCVMGFDRMLMQLRGESLTREDQYRIELARAKATDEVRRLWTRGEREAWLRGPKTQACEQAPLPVDRRQCLNGVEIDLDVFSRPDDVLTDAPAVRAERAVARLEAREQDEALARQLAHELENSRIQASGQALMGLGMGGGIFRK